MRENTIMLDMSRAYEQHGEQRHLAVTAAVVQASAASAYRKVAVNAQGVKERRITSKPGTRRGEYATALNCTMTKAIANTTPVSAIIPDATADNTARAAATDRLWLNEAR